MTTPTYSSPCTHSGGTLSPRGAFCSRAASCAAVARPIAVRTTVARISSVTETCILGTTARLKWSRHQPPEATLVTRSGAARRCTS